MCRTYKHLGKSSLIKRRGVTRTPTPYKMEFFVTLVNGEKLLTNVTWRSRCCEGPRYASESSDYKKLKNEQKLQL